MITNKIERLPYAAAVALVALALAACAIRLRGDEPGANSPEAADAVTDPLATKLRECRSVTYEQKDALSECRKAWAEKRRQFLGSKASPSSSEDGTPKEGPSLFVPRKDESRLSPGTPSMQQSGKE